MRAKDRIRTRNDRARRPLLLVDIDGVLSLFARQALPASTPSAPLRVPASASLHSIDGILHYLSADAARHLLSLAQVFDLVWASGWEEKADEYLPHLLGVPAGLPFLRFSHGARRGSAGGPSLGAHWKLDAVDAYVEDHALAWVDDAFDESCHAWATARRAPTLLVPTEPERGLTGIEALRLEAWAAAL